jgi:NADH dehydrogenase (ubiquinone) Fe-S protein 1
MKSLLLKVKHSNIFKYLLKVNKKKWKHNALFINDKKIRLEDRCYNSTILKFCDFIGVGVPRFCFHDRLFIAGNCRMCMVEIKSSFKPVIACSTTLVRGMHIYTTSFFVKKARENVMEFLLINHPLDCPICDQGGECDLQDQAIIFGSDRGRFKEVKRSVLDFFMGPVVKTIMTRCIHCTRCIRFNEEIVGNTILGRLGRGDSTEIGTYITKPFIDELSGNIVDVCPVGALTSKSYAFKARPWELKNLESIDIFDSLGSNIRIDIKGNEIVRILPKRHDYLNEEWITDKVRFSFEGLKNNRILFPMYRDKAATDFLLQSCSFSFIFNYLVNSINNIFNFYDDGESRSIVRVELSNYFTSAQDYFYISSFFSVLGIDNINYFSNALNNNIDFRYNYLVNSSLRVFTYYESYLLDNINLKTVNPLINSRLKYRKLRKGNNVNVSYIGKNISLNYDYNHISNSYFTLFFILEGKHFYSSRLFKDLNIVNNLNSNYNNLNLYNYLKQFKVDVQFTTILNSSSDVTVSDLGHSNPSSYYSENSDIIYLYNTEYLNNSQLLRYMKTKELIFHGTNISEEIKKYISVLIPSTSFFETNASFSNCIGISQNSNKVLTKLNNFYSVSDLISFTCNLSNIPQVSFAGLYTQISYNNRFEKVYPYAIIDYFLHIGKYDHIHIVNTFFTVNNFVSNNVNYYKTDNVTLNSDTLQKCSLLLLNNNNNFII